MNGGRFDFDDGGTYCGGWEDGKAHGHGVCTGPKGQGEYSGAWHYGFEVSGVYTWPSGNCYEGQWQNGKRHGLGDERRGRWVYRGEWTQGYKGRYGVRQSTNSQAKYEGTWANGLQDGYGTETYADGGTYQGQWLRGMRHGYGTRRSAPYGVAAKYRSRSHAHASLTSLRSDQGGDENIVTSTGHDGKEKKADDSRGGFVLRARSEPPSRRRSLSERSVAVKRTILQGLRIKKQRSAGDINQRVAGTGSIRSSGSTGSCASDESGVTGYSGHDHGSYVGVEEFVDPNATETYMGEWKNDKRSGFGVSERSDGLKYEGEWYNNKKFGYGVTTFKDGSKEEGKYKNNILITSQRKKNLLFVRSSKLRERIDSAVSAATRAAQISIQKADIAISRSATARDRAEQADLASLQGRDDSDIARLCAKQFAPDFHQPGADLVKRRQQNEQMGNHVGAVPKGGARSMSLHIPKHGNASLVASNAPSELVQQAAAAVTTSPMYTPPEEQPPLTTSAISHLPPTTQRPQLQHQQALKHLTFEEQSSWASTGDVVQNDSSVVATVHETTAVEPFVRSSDVALHNVAVRQHSPVSAPYYQPPQQQQPNLQRLRQQQQVDTQFHRVDVSGDYYLPPSTSVAPSYSEMGIAGVSGRQPQRGAKFRNSPLPAAERQSPTISRTPSQSSSRYSVNQILYDHLDQYNVAANPSAAKATQVTVARQSPQRTVAAEGSASAGLTRRTTLASATDWKGLPPHVDVASGEGTSSGLGSPYGPYNVEVVRRPAALKLFSREVMGESRGSMPDIAELEKTPVQMSREEAARLSSHRRQELQRMQEEAELLRSNPFRYLRYLYHPSVRAWIVRWKLPLLILLVNFGLSLMFYRLLTYSKDEAGDGDSDGR